MGSSYGGLGSSYGSYGSGFGSSYGGYGGYGSRYGGSYGGYGGSGYGGYGGSTGYGMDRYGPPNQNPAQKPQGFFESLFFWFRDFEHIIQSFGRFTFVLDSNFDALFNFFHSVLRMMERFSMFTREINFIMKIFSTFALIERQGLLSRNSTKSFLVQKMLLTLSWMILKNFNAIEGVDLFDSSFSVFVVYWLLVFLHFSSGTCGRNETKRS
eukprot:TRINITY_DN790_c0_g1_i1.p1 TRINITY_DN790_c0_g1~~TRINITY_DN790_c0_g1_i1.p1  ORF type:complete len:232 (+),score=24.67 TRINITY_DN790_c0_g1_i1:66-698(+)